MINYKLILDRAEERIKKLRKAFRMKSKGVNSKMWKQQNNGRVQRSLHV
jgi:DNA-binding ferritin-like protein (Dps family)